MKKRIEQLTCKQQIGLMCGIVLLGFGLDALSGRDIFLNAGWLLAALLCIIRPIAPERCTRKYGGDEARVKQGCRIGGAVILLFTLWNLAA